MATAKKPGSVHQLIASATGKNAGKFALTPQALTDLKKVLEHNDNAGMQVNRVAMTEFIAFLKSTHGLSTTRNTMQKYVVDKLGRKSWSTPGALQAVAPRTAAKRVAKKGGR
jgi:hypothetical protein